MKTTPRLFILALCLLALADMQAQNQAPKANAGQWTGTPPLLDEYKSGVVVKLDGSLSYDPDGDAITYTWAAPQGIVLSDIHAQIPTFTAPTVTQPTAYVFTLTVTDGALTSQPSVRTITVKPNRSSKGYSFENLNSTLYCVTIIGFNNAAPQTPVYEYRYIYSPEINLNSTTTAHLKTDLPPGFVALIPNNSADNNVVRLFYANAAMQAKLTEQMINTVDFSKTWDIANHPQIFLNDPATTITKYDDRNGNNAPDPGETVTVTSQNDIEAYVKKKCFGNYVVTQEAWTEFYYNENNQLTAVPHFDVKYNTVTAVYVTLNRYSDAAATHLTENPVSKSHLIIQPNPATTHFTIQGLEKETTLTVYDINGKMVLEKTIFPDEKIDIIGWNKGIYFIKVNDKTAKLIVR